MKIFRNLAVALLLATPAVLSAGGIGLYVPIDLGSTEKVTVTPDGGLLDGKKYDKTTDYNSAVGFGLTYDSNLGKDNLFNYRLGLEWMTRTIDTISANGYSGSCKGNGCDMSRFQIVQTFGFGVFRTELVRLWVGPRINLGYNKQTYSVGNDSVTELNFEAGIAPAVGVNLNFGRYFAVAADLDYRFAGIGGATSGSTSSSTGTNTYSGSNNGASLRVYAILKFGEDFREGGSQQQEDNSQTQQFLDSDTQQ